jgi:co-chaperonin GroES (HSP10)
MPFNAEQLAYAGRAAIDFFLKNDPIDNVNSERPLFKALVGKKKDYPGGKEFVVEQLRYSNDSNFQSYFGSSQVSYNRKRTLTQSKFKYGAFHDGFGLDEDEATANGIILNDDRQATPSEGEVVQLTNLISENMETLKLGFQEGLDKQFHRDGTASATDIAGIDAIISLDPENTPIGGLDPTTDPFWVNNIDLEIDGSDAVILVDAMEAQWRECIRIGGQAPDYILAGSKFFDAYRKAAGLTVNRQVTLGSSDGNKSPANLDAGIGTEVNGVFFKGKAVIWDPTFDVLDAEDVPATLWTNRCYFINTKHLKLRPIQGAWMIARKPPRVYDRYVHYWATTAKAALTTGKRNAHAVLSIADA